MKRTISRYCHLLTMKTVFVPSLFFAHLTFDWLILQPWSSLNIEKSFNGCGFDVRMFSLDSSFMECVKIQITPASHSALLFTQHFALFAELQMYTNNSANAQKYTHWTAQNSDQVKKYTNTNTNSLEIKLFRFSKYMMLTPLYVIKLH